MSYALFFVQYQNYTNTTPYLPHPVLKNEKWKLRSDTQELNWVEKWGQSENEMEIMQPTSKEMWFKKDNVDSTC